MKQSHKVNTIKNSRQVRSKPERHWTKEKNHHLNRSMWPLMSNRNQRVALLKAVCRMSLRKRRMMGCSQGEKWMPREEHRSTGRIGYRRLTSSSQISIWRYCSRIWSPSSKQSKAVISTRQSLWKKLRKNSKKQRDRNKERSCWRTKPMSRRRYQHKCNILRRRRSRKKEKLS